MLRLSRAEWQDIGDKQGWLEPDLGDPDHILPTGDIIKVRAKPHADKSWSVYLDSGLGEQLLCITADLRGAVLVKKVLDYLMERIDEKTGEVERLRSECGG